MREIVVKEFHDAMRQQSNLDQPSSELLEFRYRLLVEELKEVGEEVAIAMTEANMGGIGDKVKIRLLKELADLQYVLSGFAVTLGLPLEEAFYRVHKSNMSKLGEDGKPVYRDDGKVLKGPNYQPPNLEDLV